MYNHSAKLSSKSFLLALLAVPLLAVTVGAQTTASADTNGPSIKRPVDYKEFRRMIGGPEVIGRPRPGADLTTINAQALAAIGVTANQQRPTIKDMLLSDQPPPKREVHGWHVDKPETPGQQKVHPDRDGLLTIPHWSDTFAYHGLTYKYTMVGTDPKRGSATTTIPTVLIPIRFVFENGLVVDASADSIDGQTSIQGIINSPIFQSHDFNVGGISVGNTQYGDAFQRANFWESVSRGSRDYHVLLGQPTVAPAFEVHVPDYAVVFVTDPDTGTLVPLIEGFFLSEATLDAIQHANISPQTLPIVVWGNVFGWGFGAFHGMCEFPGGAQICIGTGYHPRSPSY